MIWQFAVQFDSSSLESSIQDVKVTTLELKAELSKNSQKLLALASRMQSLEQQPKRSTTRSQIMGPARMEWDPNAHSASGNGPGPASLEAASTSDNAAAVATPEASTSEATPTAVADGAGLARDPQGSSSNGGPSVNFVAGTRPEQQPSAAGALLDAASLSGMSLGVMKQLHHAN